MASTFEYSAVAINHARAPQNLGPPDSYNGRGRPTPANDSSYPSYRPPEEPAITVMHPLTPECSVFTVLSGRWVVCSTAVLDRHRW